MPLRLLYAVVILCFFAIHVIAVQKLNALVTDGSAAGIGIASGD